MKTYVITTGVLFALLVLAHIARLFAEGPGLLTNPWFIVITVAPTAFSIWAWRLVKLSSRS